MSRKMRKMTARRLDFFTNVSHELSYPDHLNYWSYRKGA